MAIHKVICVAFVVLSVSTSSFGQEGDKPYSPRYPSSDYNPINTITINTGCCNETEQDDGIKQELQDIKDLLNTIKTSLENGDYCCREPTTSPPPSTTPPTPSYPRDCYEVQQGGETTSGVYVLYADGNDPFEAYCDMETDGGGWTVFQRRADGSEDFYRDWVEYVDGFGSLVGEHWLGNTNLYFLTNQKAYSLRIDLADFEEETRFAVYDSFVVASSTDNYRLAIGAYSAGDAGDAMELCNDQQFSTRDQDNDNYEQSCSVRFKGGWWYDSCHYANLNGLYLSGPHTSYADGVEWNQWKGYYYSLKFSEMKLRPV